MPNATIHAIRYRGDNAVTLLDNEGKASVDLTPKTWADLLKARGAVTIPFRLDYEIDDAPLNVAFDNDHGTRKITILDATPIRETGTGAITNPEKEPAL